MDRRDFVQFLALLCAGANALPQQIEAYTRYYEANTPQGDQLVAIDEIYLGGLAQTSTPVIADFCVNDRLELPIAFNSFGGIVHWKPAPDRKIMVSKPDFFWRFCATNRRLGTFTDEIRGHISFIQQDSVRRNVVILKAEGSLVDA